jgi:fructokinase
MALRIGIDLGGTKIEGLVLDETGGELIRRRISTPRGDYAAIIRAIAGFVGELEAETDAGQAHVGVGIPGALSPSTGLVRNANTTEINGHPLDRDLSAALGREVKVENDANCFALSEATDGAGQGAHVVFGVIIGTGVGGGLVVGGRLVTGRHHIGGEWGHNPLPWPSLEEVRDAPPCFCGKRGCIETWVSGPAFARDHQLASGRQMRAEEIIAAATSDAQAEASYRRYAERLARGLAHLVNVIDPDVIVLGGGMANVTRLYEDLPQLMRPFVSTDGFSTSVGPARHGDSSGVRGAAWLQSGPSPNR